jgi:predicted PurR-regulated permease PerM
MQRQFVFWAGLLAVAVLALYLLSDVMLPFVAGAAIAYLLDPLADRLERLGIGRLGATIIILVVFLIVLIVALGVLIPLAARQVVSFAEQFPGYVQRLQQLLADQGGPLIERLGGQDALQQLQQSIGNMVGQGAAWVATFARSLWTGGKAIISIVSILVVTPVVAFYLLVDWDRMIATIDRWVPPRHRETVRGLAREMDKAVAGFVRGQTAVCFLLGAFYATGLTLVGLNFGATIGMLAGLISFIPYVGSLTGLLLATGVALVQFLPDWTWVLATLAVFLVGQFIEGNILSPKMVGDAVGLHPVWLMFALLAFGSVMGFVGLLVAVPLAAMIAVLGRFAIRRYQESPLYLGPLDGERSRAPPTVLIEAPRPPEA